MTTDDEGGMMNALRAELLKWTPVVVVLVVVLWAGARGHWYFGRSTRSVLDQYQRQRDEWRRLALVLLRERGIDVDPDAEDPPPRDG